MRLLALDSESNVPTWFSTLLIFSCSALAGWYATCCRSAGAPLVLRWRLVAVGLLGLSLDEAAGIHEVAPSALSRAGFPGPDRTAFWLLLIAAGAVAVAVVVVVVVPVLRSLAPRDGRRWLLAGVLLGVAVCTDLVGGGPRAGLVGSALLGLEEGLEFAAFLIVLGTLLRSLHTVGTDAAWCCPPGAAPLGPGPGSQPRAWFC